MAVDGREAGRLFVTIGADDKEFNQKMGAAEGTMNSTQSKVEKFGATATRNVTLPLLAIGAASVKMAADAEGATSKFGTVFRGMEEQMMGWVDSFSEAFPIARGELIKTSSDLQDLLVPMGVARESAATMTKQWTGLAAALAAFNDIPIGEALEAIRSGISGESEPLRKFGINASVAAVQQEALALGLAKTAKEVDAQSYQVALLSLAYRQSADAVNGLDEQQGSLLWQWDDLVATLKDLATGFGADLMPAIKDVVTVVSDAAKAFASLSPEQRDLIIRMALLAAAVGPVVSVTTKAVTGFNAFKTAIGTFNITDTIARFLGLSAAQAAQTATATTAAGASAAAAAGTTAAGAAAGAATAPVAGLGLAFNSLLGPVGLVIGILSVLGIAAVSLSGSFQDVGGTTKDATAELEKSAAAAGDIEISMAAAAGAVGELVEGQDEATESTEILNFAYRNIMKTLKELPEAQTIITTAFKELNITFDESAIANTATVNEMVTAIMAELYRIGTEGAPITKDGLKSLLDTYEEFKTSLTAEVDSQTDGILQQTIDMMEGVVGITEEKKADILAAIAALGSEQKEEINSTSGEIIEIIQTAADEHRAITTEEWLQVLELTRMMKAEQINIYSESQNEQLAILESISSQTERLSTEQAQQVIEKAKEAYEGATAAAESRYIDEVGYVQRLRDELGVITNEQAQEMIDTANSEKEESVSISAQKYKEVLELTQDGLNSQLEEEAKAREKLLAEKQAHDTAYLQDFDSYRATIESKSKEVWDSLTRDQRIALVEQAGDLGTSQEEREKILKNILDNMAASSLGLVNVTKEQFDLMQEDFDKALAIIGTETQETYDGIEKTINEASEKIGVPAADYRTKYLAEFKKLPEDMEKAASNAIDSFNESLKNGTGKIGKTAYRIGRSVIDNVNLALDIQSPSHEMDKSAAYTTEGFVNRLIAGLPDVYGAAREMGKAAISGVGDASNAASIAQAATKVAGALGNNSGVPPAGATNNSMTQNLYYASQPMSIYEQWANNQRAAQAMGAAVGR